jgi:SOS-response transcriptional repressor LexA
MRAAAEHAGLTQKEVGEAVARRIGRQRPYTEAAVGQWYADKTEPGNAALVEFARVVNADLLWLQTGIGRGAGQLPREGRAVPTITLEQATKDPIDYATEEMIHTYYPCSEKAFIIPIDDGRNEPTYKAGYRVVIDPQRKPSPGKMVLAVINREPVFGQYAEKTGKRIVILALNDKWPAEILNPKKGDRIVGTMTEFAGQAP